MSMMMKLSDLPEPSSPFGWRTHPITRRRQFHNGCDYPLTVGTRIDAPFDGTVNRWISSTGGLQCRLISNSSPRISLGFAHLSSVLAGDSVKKGEPLCASGNSGKSTGPHLHMTYRVGTGLADPQIFVKVMKSL